MTRLVFYIWRFAATTRRPLRTMLPAAPRLLMLNKLLVRTPSRTSKLPNRFQAGTATNAASGHPSLKRGLLYGLIVLTNERRRISSR